MKLSYLPYLILSIIAGLTVGILLAVFVGVTAMLHSLLAFPIQVYRTSTARLKEVEQIIQNENIWDRHIRRMEDKKQQYKDHDPV
tara:strand:+ start:1029 stop:1283 length:255 start_codon:yes stop_codon:yes gene_type:complete